MGIPLKKHLWRTHAQGKDLLKDWDLITDIEHFSTVHHMTVGKKKKQLQSAECKEKCSKSEGNKDKGKFFENLEGKKSFQG